MHHLLKNNKRENVFLHTRKIFPWLVYCLVTKRSARFYSWEGNKPSWRYIPFYTALLYTSKFTTFSDHFMKQRLDQNQDLCQDFYKFTCGKYLKRPERVLPSVKQIARREAEEEATKIVSELINKAKDSDLLQLAKNALHSCINEGKFI